MAKYYLEKELGEISNTSSIWLSEAWGKKDQSDFLNLVLTFPIQKTPREVLDLCLSTENKMGRVRDEKWGPRSIDIDILFFADQMVDEKGLLIPHKQIANRRFVLLPLAEIDTDLVHPDSAQTITEMIASCDDDSKLVRLYDL